MTRFSTRNISRADVPAARTDIWDVLVDPDALADLTPLLDGIGVDGDRWCWKLGGIRALGVEVAPSFTEEMTFDEPSCITFRHAPPTGAAERAGADGVYELTDLDPGWTHLFIDIALHVELPLPALSRRAVERVMTSTMTRTGDVFAQRLYTRLGIDASSVEVGTTAPTARVDA